MASIDLGANAGSLPSSGGGTSVGSGGGTGTVTNIATGSGLTGGPITTTGTLAVSSVSLTGQVVGTLPMSQGGSGTASFAAGSIVFVGRNSSYAQDSTKFSYGLIGTSSFAIGTVPTIINPPGLSVWGATNTNLAIFGNSGGGTSPCIVYKSQTTYAEVQGAQSNLAGVADLAFQPEGGNTGINVAPLVACHIHGAVRMDSFGAGAATFDGSGNISSASDGKLKDIQKEFTKGLEALSTIKPVIYKWNKESEMDMRHEYAGLIAQNVQESIPEAIGQDAKGYLSLQDRALIAVLINAVNELSSKVKRLEGERARIG